MNKLNIVMTDVPAGRFGSYIPVIIRHVANIEVQRVIHAVPTEHSIHFAAMAKMLVESARESVENADLVIIPGGIDINPKIYGQEPGRFTDQHSPLSCRDEVETMMINTALELNKPIILICRGFQLALALLCKNKEHTLRFCQHLPNVTSAVHRSSLFMDGKELLFNSRYIGDELIKDIKLNQKSPMTSIENVVHKLIIYPGTIAHYLYKNAFGLPHDYNLPLEIDELSHHHQCFLLDENLTMPEGLVASSLSLAGDEVPILEGFEDHSKSLCAGFQFHLEANASGYIAEIFKEILDYAVFWRDTKSANFLEWTAIKKS